MEKEKKCPECTHRIKKRTEEETKLMINRLNRIEKDETIDELVTVLRKLMK